MTKRKKKTKIVMLGLVIREMAENGFICKDINAGSPDKQMSSTMRTNMATGQPGRSTRERGSNGTGNDKDGGQQD